MLQLAPARAGMNLSPCLLGDDSGEFVEVMCLITSVTFGTMKISDREVRHNNQSKMTHFNLQWYNNKKVSDTSVRLTMGLVFSFWMLICLSKRRSYSWSIMGT